MALLNSGRNTARIVGILFLIATAAPLLSIIFVPVIIGPESIENVWLLAANETNTRIGALLEFTMAVAVASIPICIYPIMKKQNQSMALGYVIGRLVEGIMFTIGTICLIVLLTLSKEYAITGTSDALTTQLGLLVLSIRSAQSIFAQFSFSLGSLMFYYMLYKTKLIPRWLSSWSLIGAVMFLASAFVVIFGSDSSSTTYLLLNAPGGLGEMVFAIWLIIKGFNTEAFNQLSEE